MKILLKTIHLLFTCLWYKIVYYFSNNKLECLKNFTNNLQEKNYIFIKVLQSISTNSDLFDEEQMKLLLNYNDNVKYLNEEIDIGELESNIHKINENVEDKLFLLSKKPIKSGMISVIYEGVINNKDVVIKVYRNDIQEKIKSQYEELYYIMNYISYIPFVHLEELIKILNDTKDTMLKQCVIKNERDNIKKMYKLYNNLDNIKIPLLYDNHSCDTMIVMERFNGKNILSLTEEEKKYYSKIISDYTVTSVFYKRLVHADLHEGNIFFIENGDNKEVGLIDFGLMIHITREQQDTYYRLLEAISLKNKKDAVDIFIYELLEPKEKIKNLSTHLYNVLYKQFDNILDLIIEEKMDLDTNLIYNSVEILKKNGLKFAKYISEIELSIGVSSNICKYLSNDKHHLNDIIETFRYNSSCF